MNNIYRRGLINFRFCIIGKLQCRKTSIPLAYPHFQSRTGRSRACNFLITDTCTRNMSTVHVKNVGDDERLQIIIDLTTKDGKSKTFNLNRLKTEEHAVALERLRLNLSKKMTKKKKKKTKENASPDSEPEPESDAFSLDIVKDGLTTSPSVANENAWIEGAFLRYGEEEISIICNVPSVTLDKFPTKILAGFPLFPIAKFEFCDPGSCDFFWKVIEKNEVPKYSSAIGKKELNLSSFENSFQCLSYTPSVADIGCHILLACIPKKNEKEGKPDVRLSEVSVEPRPSTVCPFEKRHEFTKSRSGEGEFRVVSYNLLADLYSSTDFAESHLFAHCPKEFLEMDYRKHLLLKEIIGYQADLMCFQEVDRSIFASHLVPALRALGFEGLMCAKSGQSSEGCATFIRSDKFRIVNQLDIVLSEYLMQDPSCQDIWEKVKVVEPLKENIVQRSSILQVTVVESLEKPNEYVCLANTHLYFRPTACNIRLLHAAAALRHLQNICNSYEHEGKKASVVFCGDFNSSPRLGIYQLFTMQFVPSDHMDWLSAGEEERVTDLELSHSMNIGSACGVPDYTNYTVGFQRTLDYIYTDMSKLQVVSVVPMPDHSDVIANVALPSVVFPSDHIALVCDMKFSS